MSSYIFQFQCVHFVQKMFHLLIKQLLDLNTTEAQKTLDKVSPKYPIVITRDINLAKQWLKENARGTERYGIVVSSQAERLKPQSIFVKSPMNPIHWFLNGKEDIDHLII